MKIFDYHSALFDNPKKNSVLLIDPGGIILEANRAFLLSFGYDKEDVLGQHFSLLFSEEDRQKDMPGREIRMVLEEGQSFDNNYLVNKNKVLTWVSGESVLLTDEEGAKYILKVIQNIHTQKESELSITLLNRFNENILSAIEYAVLVLNKNFHVLKANRAAGALFNFPGQFPASFDFRETLRELGSDEGLSDLVKEIFLSGSASSKIQLNLQINPFEQKAFEVSCIRVEQDGDENMLLLFNDITAQKNFDRQREDILNFVAHELSNPLTNIMLNIQLMDEITAGERSQLFQGCMERCTSNVQRLKKMVSELYQSSKLASGNITLEKTSFTLNDMVEEAIQSLRQLYPHYNITTTASRTFKVSADKDKLIRVMNNYLTNAVKYSAGYTNIEVEIRAGDHSVITSVTDHGNGIPENDLPFVFDRFFRAEKTKGLEGLGLGLFLSRQIIEAHQGRCFVKSTEGKGSTFYFSLPFNPDAPSPPAVLQS